ncbi:hypothetical protein GFC01_02010 [Desulfofundulus thermobenzoicus]|uniref:Type II secretion system protein n=1 Tax=Desulfofundulus thermobenzoicus TaxID=29376 RepID=A0A6N7IN41_9FIRM|nr:hypothetical protein [Desulfofundulus thermobenzoicus]MQL51063.1 hypothetical protein [Desulfofundulus thermobenzoicus]
MWRLRKIDDRGYTLITVIAAMFIFGAASFLLSAVMARSIQAARAADAGAVAGYLAFQEEQLIMGLPFNNVVSQPPAPVDAVKYPGFTRAVDVSTQSGGYVKKITVTVTYPVPGSLSRNKKLTFYRAVDQPAN